jgi:cytochrome c biogenesis protein ResB
MSVDAGKTLAEEPRRPAAAGWSRTFGLLNPLRAVWWLFTNVRFAILLLAVLSLVSLLGVVLPQVPLNVRGDTVAEADWLRVQEGRFGFLTDPIHRVGLFDVFHTNWFAVLMAFTVVATGAYIVSRFPGIWHAITKPRKRVPERYFEMAPNRVDVPSSVDVSRLEELLRRRRYRVERSSEAGVTYLFADRFQWAALGTLLTHAAVIVFILSAVVSRVDAFSSPLFLSEGATLPVFPVRDPNQMQVQLTDARATFASDGQPLDYRSELVIYQRGEEVLACESTVNSPCSYNGFRFYQAAYFGYGAALQVRDLDTGNVIYQETLALSGKAPAPRVTVRDTQGQVLLDDALVLAETVKAGDTTYSAALTRLPDGRPLTFWLPQAPDQGGDKLIIFEPGSGENSVRLSLGQGETGQSGGLEVSYVREEMAPSLLVPDLPLPRSLGEGATGAALLQLGNVVYGTGTTSEGTKVQASAPNGPPRLTLVGLQPQPLTLEPGQKATIDNYEYTFLGQREFAGIEAKRDRSDYLVWIGAGLIVLGLMITFWVPRRRLWARITATRTSLAGQAASHAQYARELRRLAAEAGAAMPGGTEEDD